MANPTNSQSEEGAPPPSSGPKCEALKFPWEGDTDATIMANLAIGNLREALQAWLRSERGVHAETLMVVVGALAGFTAQTAALRSLGSPARPVPNGARLMVEARGQTVS